MEKIMQLNIPVRISSHWRRLGLRLGLAQDDLDSFEAQTTRNNIRCCQHVFKYWVDEGGHPVIH